MAETRFKYLSNEWSAECTKRFKKELTPEQMKHVTSSLLTVYNNCPDGKTRSVLYKITNGVVDQVSVVEGTPPKAEFSVTADYDLFAKISRAEVKARAALMSGKMTLKGNLVKALRLSPIMDRLNKVMSTIPTDF